MTLRELDEETALEIRKLYLGRSRPGYSTLGARFGVSGTTIMAVVKGSHWAAQGLPDLRPSRPKRRGVGL